MKQANIQNRGARYNSNSYYMHTANALAHDYPVEQPRVEQPVSKKVKTTSKKRHFVIASIPDLARVVCVFVLAMALVGQYIYIQGLGYEVSKTKDELNLVLNNNEKLKQQYAALGDLKMVEAKAIYNLGMIKPENNVAYLPHNDGQVVSSNEGVKAAAAPEQSATDEGANNVLATISSLLETLRF